MSKLMKYLACLCVFALATAGIAKADTVFTLNIDGCSGAGCGAGPYGTIDLSQVGSNVNVTVTLNPGYVFISSGAGDALEFNATGTITNISAGFGVGPAPDHASVFGTFLESVTCTGCGSGGSAPLPGPLTFTVNNVTIADFIANSDGNYFASDIGQLSTGDVLPVIATGNVGAGGGTSPSPVPEPSSLLLLGTGLVLLAGFCKARLAV
jgi:PEP-CTERM motif